MSLYKERAFKHTIILLLADVAACDALAHGSGPSVPDEHCCAIIFSHVAFALRPSRFVR